MISGFLLWKRLPAQTSQKMINKSMEYGTRKRARSKMYVEGKNKRSKVVKAGDNNDETIFKIIELEGPAKNSNKQHSDTDVIMCKDTNVSSNDTCENSDQNQSLTDSIHSIHVGNVSNVAKCHNKLEECVTNEDGVKSFINHDITDRLHVSNTRHTCDESQRSEYTSQAPTRPDVSDELLKHVEGLDISNNDKIKINTFILNLKNSKYDDEIIVTFNALQNIILY